MLDNNNHNQFHKINNFLKLYNNHLRTYNIKQDLQRIYIHLNSRIYSLKRIYKNKEISNRKMLQNRKKSNSI